MIRKLTVLMLLLTPMLISAQQFEIKTLNSDGAWCWFSDPRAIYVHGEDALIITGWVKKDGSVELASLNVETGNVESQTVYEKLEEDDHNNPAFLEKADGSVTAYYTTHYPSNLYTNVYAGGEEFQFSKTVELFPIGKEELEKYPKRTLTYANPYQLRKENNRIYVFGRWTGFKPNVMWSDDNGKTYTKSKVFIAEDGFRGGNRPYVKYFSDGKSKIHIVFTDGHPRNEPTNSVYYMYYESGAFWKADGTKICGMDEMPVNPKKATVIYKATEETGRAWVYDIIADKKGNPTILYARYPTEEEHLYEYATFDGKQWHKHPICNSGKWFPETQEGKVEKEPHYSGGMTIHPLKHNEIYVSREVNGTFEIEKFVTSDNGENWNITPITKKSKFDNVRPYIPRNMSKKDKTVVLWMENEQYTYYRNFNTRIKYTID